MSEREDDTLLQFMIPVIIVAIMLLALCGCCSTKTVYEPVEVLVPVTVAPPPLPIPESVEKESLLADESDWQAYLKAMVRDLLRAWAHIELLEDRIKKYNEAAANIPDPQ